MGRAIAYAGLVAIGLGMLGALVASFVGSAALMNLGSVLMGLGLVAFIIGVGVHLLNREGDNRQSKM